MIFPAKPAYASSNRDTFSKIDGSSKKWQVLVGFQTLFITLRPTPDWSRIKTEEAQPHRIHPGPRES